MKYRYSREERLSMPNAPRLDIRYRKGIFKGNRSLLIVLLDVMLIALMVFLFRGFIFNPSHVALKGVEIELRGRVIKDSIYATVRLDCDKVEEQRVYVRFQFGESEEHRSAILTGGEPIEISAFLPSEKGRTLKATIRIGEEEKTLSWRPG